MRTWNLQGKWAHSILFKIHKKGGGCSMINNRWTTVCLVLYVWGGGNSNEFMSTINLVSNSDSIDQKQLKNTQRYTLS